MTVESPESNGRSGRAVVLLSGGMDSATTLALARSEGFECFALTVDYGQRCRAELEAAASLAASLGAAGRLVLKVDLGAVGGSALTDDIDVPKHKQTDGIPVTYVPARNALLLSLALGWAEVLGAEVVFIGVTGVDYSGYPDCRPEFVQAFQTVADVGTKAGVSGRSVRIRAPLVDKSKADIVRLGLKLGVDFRLTQSCYAPTPDGRPCGECESCRLRAKGFGEVGVSDPLLSGPGE